MSKRVLEIISIKFITFLVCKRKVYFVFKKEEREGKKGGKKVLCQEGEMGKNLCIIWEE